MSNLDPKDLLKMDKEVNTSKIDIDVIVKLVNKYPNDMDLGREIRKVINSLEVKS